MLNRRYVGFGQISEDRGDSVFHTDVGHAASGVQTQVRARGAPYLIRVSFGCAG